MVREKPVRLASVNGSYIPGSPVQILSSGIRSVAFPDNGNFHLLPAEASGPP